MGNLLSLILPHIVLAIKDLFIPPENDTPSKAKGRIFFLISMLLLCISLFIGDKVVTLHTAKQVNEVIIQLKEEEIARLTVEVAELKAELSEQKRVPYDSTTEVEFKALRREYYNEHEQMMDFINN